MIEQVLQSFELSFFQLGARPPLRLFRSVPMRKRLASFHDTVEKGKQEVSVKDFVHGSGDESCRKNL
jgi:hypothetical protein